MDLVAVWFGCQKLVASKDLVKVQDLIEVKDDFNAEVPDWVTGDSYLNRSHDWVTCSPWLVSPVIVVLQKLTSDIYLYLLKKVFATSILTLISPTQTLLSSIDIRTIWTLRQLCLIPWILKFYYNDILYHQKWNNKPSAVIFILAYSSIFIY